MGILARTKDTNASRLAGDSNAEAGMVASGARPLRNTTAASLALIAVMDVQGSSVVIPPYRNVMPLGLTSATTLPTE